jgi:hypothetical protein
MLRRLFCKRMKIKKRKPDALGLAVCEALGVSPDQVRRIEIIIEAGSIPAIKIEIHDFENSLDLIDWSTLPGAGIIIQSEA